MLYPGLQFLNQCVGVRFASENLAESFYGFHNILLAGHGDGERLNSKVFCIDVQFMAVVLVDDQIRLEPNPGFNTGIQQAANFGQGAGFFGINAKIGNADHTVAYTPVPSPV